MKRSFHDLSVFFDDDGKVYVVWGYRDRAHRAAYRRSHRYRSRHRAPELVDKDAGMGEGSHLYKINGKYFLTSAWYDGVMRLVGARADKLTGRWEVNRNISAGEQFGQVLGWRLSTFARRLPPSPLMSHRRPMPPIRHRPHGHPPGRHHRHADRRMVGIQHGRSQRHWPRSHALARHLGRRMALLRTARQSWKNSAHLGQAQTREPSRSPMPPMCAATTSHSRSLQPSGNGTMSRRREMVAHRAPRLPASARSPATSLWDARNTLTQRSIGPRSTPTAVIDASGLKPGDVAGFALLIQPDAWLGMEKTDTA
jgi:xylan 1,4-beta-xylosidase